MIANIFIIPTGILLFALIRRIPIKPIQHIANWVVYQLLVPIWIDLYKVILQFGSRTQWVVTQKGELKTDGWYFLMSNHCSWLDILVLTAVTNRKIPSPKFFMKQELLWSLPIIGIGCWLLDFPFMKRHSKEYLKKHPEQRHKDIETTRKKCALFKKQPVTIINFLEGTRFTQEKHSKLQSPYQHLLPPKAGGMAFSLAAMEGVLHDMIDVTLYYHPKGQSLWDTLCGRVDKIFIDIEVLPIPDSLRGDYIQDAAFKKQFQQWLNARWQRKDEKIAQMIKDASL